jgi:hypothetical protein
MDNKRMWRSALLAIAMPAAIYRLVIGNFSVETSGQEFLIVVLVLVGGFAAVALD